jgi:flagellar export protein FliJ
MSPKRQKIKKVLDLKDQALEKRALELSQSKTTLQGAIDEHSLESERLLVAEKHRQELTAGLIDVGSWIEAEQWLAHRRTELGRADGRVAAAEAQVKAAFTGVVEARIDKKRIELLDERLAQGEVTRENRIEQRLTDELALRARKRDV